MNTPSAHPSENASDLRPPRILLPALIIFALNSIRLSGYLVALRKEAIAIQPTSITVSKSIVLAPFPAGGVEADLLRKLRSLAGGIVSVQGSRRVVACYFRSDTRGVVGEDGRFVSLNV